MKEIKTFLVTIKTNTKLKAKWYYGYLNKEDNLEGKEIRVADDASGTFRHCYNFCHGTTPSYSLYIDKEDCEIIKPTST